MCFICNNIINHHKKILSEVGHYDSITRVGKEAWRGWSPRRTAPEGVDVLEWELMLLMNHCNALPLGNV